ncbi:MAG: hypothetical protein ACMVO3_11565 [Thalassobaculum sp.]
MARFENRVSSDYFSASSQVDLKSVSSGHVFGRSLATYRIQKRRDVKNNKSLLGYVLAVKQRVIIPNATVYRPGPISISAYENYPALMATTITLTSSDGSVPQLVRIFPRTLNSSVSTSRSSDDGTNTTETKEHTQGQTHSDVSGFTVGGEYGTMMGSPVAVGNASFSYSHEDSKMQSKTKGESLGVSQDLGFDDSMSIKDWSSYGYLDASAVNPTWIFGQSYPWDVIQYNHSSNGSTIDLPDFVSKRLLDKDKSGAAVLMPPSQLSQFGVDFTMSAAWLIDFPDGLSEEEMVSVDHETTLYTASHSLAGDNVTATLQSSSDASTARFSSGDIDLSVYALSPLSSPNSENGSAIGFTATPFTIAPSDDAGPFKVVSPGNALQVTGSGFKPGLTSSFAATTSLKLVFKVADYDQEYALLLMHWIGEKSGAVKLSWTVNDTWSGVLYVDSKEGEGGQGNTSSIELRNMDFTSINFHDYLRMGTNEIDIDISPVDEDAGAEYTLFAAAIGPA